MTLNVISVQVLPISTAKDPTLLGFCVFTIDNSFEAADIGLHSKEGRYYLLFPTKRLRSGGFIHYFRPIDRGMGETMLEKAVAAYRKAILSEGEREVVRGEGSQG